MSTGSYLTDQPISLYTQKAAEGSIPTSLASKGGNIFARSTQFTNEITDTYVESMFYDKCLHLHSTFPLRLVFVLKVIVMTKSFTTAQPMMH